MGGNESDTESEGFFAEIRREYTEGREEVERKAAKQRAERRAAQAKQKPSMHHRLRVSKIRDVLDQDERVVYVTGSIDLRITGAQQDRKSGRYNFKGAVRVAATDQRVVVRIPGWAGTNHQSIAYHSVTDVEFDSGWAHDKVRLETKRREYTFQSLRGGTSRGQLRGMVRYIRNQANKSQSLNQTLRTKSVTPTPAEPDITDQLRKLGELHESGVLTDEEFGEQKTKLLDRL